jgi:hypothetical protein
LPSPEHPKTSRIQEKKMSVTEWAAVILAIAVTIVAWTATTTASADPESTSVVPFSYSVTIYRPECRPVEEAFWAHCGGDR